MGTDLDKFPSYSNKKEKNLTNLSPGLYDNNVTIGKDMALYETLQKCDDLDKYHNADIAKMEKAVYSPQEQKMVHMIMYVQKESGHWIQNYVKKIRINKNVLQQKNAEI